MCPKSCWSFSGEALACHAWASPPPPHHRARHRAALRRSPPACFPATAVGGSETPPDQGACKIGRVLSRRKTALSLRSFFSQRKRRAHPHEHRSRCALEPLQPADRKTNASRSARAPQTPERHWESLGLLQRSQHSPQHDGIEVALHHPPSTPKLHHDARAAAPRLLSPHDASQPD